MGEVSPQVPMGQIIAKELEVIGSHGMQAYRYSALLSMVEMGKLSPEKLIRQTIELKDVVSELPAMDSFKASGLTIIEP